MPAAKELTVTTGWGQGRKAHFVGFAEGNGGLSAQHVGPTTTVITALPRKGDAIVEIDGEKYACWFRNLDPFPARVVVVHEDLCRLDLAQLDDVDSLPKIADLGVRFLRRDHKQVCSRLKRLVAQHGEFAWVHYGHHAAVLVVGVIPGIRGIRRTDQLDPEPFSPMTARLVGLQGKRRSASPVCCKVCSVLCVPNKPRLATLRFFREFSDLFNMHRGWIGAVVQNHFP